MKIPAILIGTLASVLLHAGCEPGPYYPPPYNPAYSELIPDPNSGGPNRLAIASRRFSVLTVYDIEENSWKNHEMPSRPLSLAVDEKGHWVAVGTEDGLWVMDLDTESERRIQLGLKPEIMQVQPGTERLWIASSSDTRLETINLAEGGYRFIELDQQPTGMLHNSTGTRVYVTTSDSNDSAVTVLDSETGSRVAWIEARDSYCYEDDGYPCMTLAVAPKGDFLLGCDLQNRSLSVFDLRENLLMESGALPCENLLNRPGTDEVWVLSGDAISWPQDNGLPASIRPYPFGYSSEWMLPLPVLFTPDGKVLLGANYTHEPPLIHTDLESGERQELPTTAPIVRIHATGDRLMTVHGSALGGLMVWDAHDLSLVTRLEGFALGHGK